MSFYKKTWFIIVMLIFFFPVGIYLMWKFSNWNSVIKTTISGFFVGLGIISIFFSLTDIGESVTIEPDNKIEEQANTKTKTNTKTKSEKADKYDVVFAFEYSKQISYDGEIQVKVGKKKLKLNIGEKKNITVPLSKGKHKITACSKEGKEMGECYEYVNGPHSVSMEISISNSSASFLLNGDKDSTSKPQDTVNYEISKEHPLEYTYNDEYSVGNLKFILKKYEMVSYMYGGMYANVVRVHIDIINGDRNKVWQQIGKIELPDDSYTLSTDSSVETIGNNNLMQFGNSDDDRIDAARVMIKNDSNQDYIIQGIFSTTKQLKHKDNFKITLYFYDNDNKLEINLY